MLDLRLRFSQWRQWKVPSSRMWCHVVPYITNIPPRVCEFLPVYTASSSRRQNSRNIQILQHFCMTPHNSAQFCMKYKILRPFHTQEFIKHIQFTTHENLLIHILRNKWICTLRILRTQLEHENVYLFAVYLVIVTAIHTIKRWMVGWVAQTNWYLHLSTVCAH
jgi:hypothetical protein